MHVDDLNYSQKQRIAYIDFKLLFSGMYVGLVASKNQEQLV